MRRWLPVCRAGVRDRLSPYIYHCPLPPSPALGAVCVEKARTRAAAVANRKEKKIEANSQRMHTEAPLHGKKMSEQDNTMEPAKLIEDHNQMADFVMDVILGNDSAKTSRFALATNIARFITQCLARRPVTVSVCSIVTVELAVRRRRLYARMPATILRGQSTAESTHKTFHSG